MLEPKKYVIGGKTYCQQTLVYGQIRQVLGLLKTIKFPGMGKDIFFTVADVIDLLGDGMLTFLAIVLIPDGETAKEKDNGKISQSLEWEIDSQIILEVMDDFFSYNRISAVQKKIMEISKRMSLGIQSKSSTPSSPKLREAISPKENTSSGR